MKTATLIKDNLSDFNGHAALYHLDPPTEDGMEYVIVSACNAYLSGPETLIFDANPDGTIKSWAECDGSFHGSWDHHKALHGLGYEIK